ncbi:hypothetical protein SLS64_009697 [Diaporthe eres]
MTTPTSGAVPTSIEKFEDGGIEHVENQDNEKNTGTHERFGSVAKTDRKEIALVRKLDLYLMPILWLMYFLNFLCRNAIVNGKLNNLQEELKMNGTEYNTCVSIFFVGIILGFTEAPYYSGACYLVIAVAVLASFILPNKPLDTPWLNAEEKQLADFRVSRDTTEKRIAGKTWTGGLKQACLDYRTWIFAFVGNLHLSANNFKNYMPTAVESLGFNDTISLVLTCPPYLFGAFTSIAVSWSSGHFNERTWHIAISKAVAILGFAVATGTHNIGARYFAMFIFVGATYGVNNINLSWTSSTLGQTDEKRAAAIAIVNTLGNLSFVYTPYLWNDEDSPLFRPAMIASIGFSFGVALTAWLMKWILVRQNKRIREGDNEAVNFYAY